MSIFKRTLVILFIIFGLNFIYEQLVLKNENFLVMLDGKIQQLQEPKVSNKEIKDTTNTFEPKVYFVKLSKNGNEEITIVKRASVKGSSDKHNLEIAIKKLFEGPTSSEKKLGYFSEIPATTKLLSLEKYKYGLKLNLSEDFVYGGGAESMIKRCKQLIETVLANKPQNVDVYLFVNNKLVSTIGGEGIMINQPLNRSSLND